MKYCIKHGCIGQDECDIAGPYNSIDQARTDLPYIIASDITSVLGGDNSIIFEMFDQLNKQSKEFTDLIVQEYMKKYSDSQGLDDRYDEASFESDEFGFVFSTGDEPDKDWSFILIKMEEPYYEQFKR